MCDGVLNYQLWWGLDFHQPEPLPPHSNTRRDVIHDCEERGTGTGGDGQPNPLRLSSLTWDSIER